MLRRFYNSHVHCFTYDHVPEYFLTRWIAISWLLKRAWLRRLIKRAANTGEFPLVIRFIIFVLRFAIGLDKSMALRYVNFVKYGDRVSQEDVIKSIQAYYPKDTGFVMLSMDMEFMGAGAPKTSYEKQLRQLEGVSRNPAWKGLVYPFIFADPRRIDPQHPREKKVNTSFTGTVFTKYLKDSLREGYFQGIKMYPALGYFPFDKRMHDIYDFAIARRIPLMTHCTVGAVHHKYWMDPEERRHPYRPLSHTHGTNLPYVPPKDFQVFLTHPLNFECLLNRQLLQQYWGPDAPDYRELKVCLGHWGTGDDWHAYLDNAWVDTFARKTKSDWCALELDNWVVAEDQQYKNYSWFTIICELIRKYPNVYADISYTLCDERLLPLLKMILEADKKIRSRVLFGTDFYLVSKEGSERAFAIKVRAALGAGLFDQIARRNVEEYLSNDFFRVSSADVIATPKLGL